jgi:hypothetical protein
MRRGPETWQDGGFSPPRFFRATGVRYPLRRNRRERHRPPWRPWLPTHAGFARRSADGDSLPCFIRLGRVLPVHALLGLLPEGLGVQVEAAVLDRFLDFGGDAVRFRPGRSFVHPKPVDADAVLRRLVRPGKRILPAAGGVGEPARNTEPTRTALSEITECQASYEPLQTDSRPVL